MISKFQSTQRWLSQFSHPHRKTAESLLDNIIFVNTADVIEDLKFLIGNLVNNEDKVAILPIRELRDGEHVYNLDDKDKCPDLQTSKEALGSEAFISNLYTQLNRVNKKNFPMQSVITNSGWYEVSPSLSYMAKNKYNKLLLIDDLIGSGDRVQGYLDSILSHKTIKSWLSGGFIEIYIVSYMASIIGINKIKKSIVNKKGLHLKFLHEAPTFHDVIGREGIFELCRAYASQKNKNPLGYNECAVRVVFGHSAPNNMPAILHASTLNNFKAFDNGVSNSPVWNALFHKRVIPSDFLIDCKKRNCMKPKDVVLSFLTLLSSDSYQESELSRIYNLPAYEVDRVLKNMESLGWVVYQGKRYHLTNGGHDELTPKNKVSRQVEIITGFYYPWR